jgi:hypothetical protein
MSRGIFGKTGEFGSLAAVIGSAAFAVGIVFSLFNSVLQNLAPPIQDSNQTVAFMSLVGVIVLVILSILFKQKLDSTKAVRFAVISFAFLLAAVLFFIPYRATLREHVYRFPPSSQPNDQQTRHISGKLSEQGRRLVGNGSISDAVFTWGGPDEVQRSGKLWTFEAYRAAETKLEIFYVCLVLLTTASMFFGALALWRLPPPKTSRSSPKPK